nr:hypothetical protein CFP56_18364 [Quercus suber]
MHTWQSYRNVQELRAAGIHVEVERSKEKGSCLSDISFTTLGCLGYLWLPPIIVDDSTRPKFLNLITYEMCLDFKIDFGITSYISFLDSLIDKANDVKMLRKAGILHNCLGSDEEVAQVFNEIGTDLVDACDGCNVEVEDSIHFFWKCTRAKELWSSSKLVFPIEFDQLNSFKEMLWCLIMDEKCSTENIELIVTCAWAMWNNRNTIRHGGTHRDGKMLLQWATEYLVEFRTVMDLLPAAQESIQYAMNWSLPLATFLKFNVDGAIFVELQSVGVGVIAWDWNGRFIATMCKQIHAPLRPLEAKLKAVEIGLQFAKQLGVSNFIIEGDSLIVSRALSQSSSVPASIDAVIMGIRSAALDFHNVYFSHVKRNANTPAHLLAKYAKGIVHQCMWMENCPSFLELAILHDEAEAAAAKEDSVSVDSVSRASSLSGSSSPPCSLFSSSPLSLLS